MKSVIHLSLLAFALTGISSWAQHGAAPHVFNQGGGLGPVASAPARNAAHPGKNTVTLGRPGWCKGGNCSRGRQEWGDGAYYWSGNDWGYSPYAVAGLNPYWELGEPAQSQPSSSQQPSVIVVREPEQKATSAPPASPKIIEVPQGESAQGKKAAPAGPVPTAVFILANGQRIESRNYLLTQDKLRLQHGRDQQVIPLSELNVEATITANRARGIDLQIPDNKNQLTLGF